MNKSKITIALISSLLASGGVIAAVTREFPWDREDPESFKLEQLLQGGKLRPEDWANLEKEKAIRESLKKMSFEEKIKIKEEAQARHLKEQQASTLPKVLPAPKLGIIEDGIDNPFSSLVFRQVERAWRGYVDGNLFTVTTGSVYSNPSQGVIVVLDDIFSDPKQYLSPTAAGPLQIVAEKQGVLTLKSIPGEFEVYL